MNPNDEVKMPKDVAVGLIIQMAQGNDDAINRWEMDPLRTSAQLTHWRERQRVIRERSENIKEGPPDANYSGMITEAIEALAAVQ